MKRLYARFALWMIRSAFAARSIRVLVMYPCEPAPTVLSPDFLNMIPQEIEALIAASKDPKLLSPREFAGRARKGVWQWLRRS